MSINFFVKIWISNKIANFFQLVFVEKVTIIKKTFQKKTDADFFTHFHDSEIFDS